jgi:hypothetical protein
MCGCTAILLYLMFSFFRFLADVCAKASKGYAFLADAEDPYN